MDSSTVIQDITDRLSQVVGDAPRPVPLHAPEFGGDEWALVKDCLDTGWVSSVGKYVDQFEQEVARHCGTAYAVALVNGTAALEISLRLVGVARDTEVLLPALTFVATANAVAHAEAIPHFVDCAEETLGLDPAALDMHLSRVAERRDGATVNHETGRRLAAVVPMHVFGHPVDMPALADVAARWDLPVVEDAAESLGSRRDGRLCGGFGHVAAISFNGNKIITTGGGGAIATNDPDLAARAKHLTTTAKRPHRWAFEHDEVAWNYRLPNLNAALGCAQFLALPNRLAAKHRLARRYAEAFEECEWARVVAEPAGCESNYWLNTLRLTPRAAPLRDALLDALNDAGFQCRPVWQLMHRLAFHMHVPHSDLAVSEALEASLISLPSSASLGRP